MRLVKIRVLDPQGLSKWARPSFVKTKKNGTVRWISDPRELNKVVVPNVYPLPIISDIPKKRVGYIFY